MSDWRANKLWVVKIGSTLLTANGQGLDGTAIAGWVNQIVQLREAGCSVLLVSSGAVAEGIKRLGWKKRPHAVHQLQAAAAVGQMGLIQAYESAFQVHHIHTAQILLTHDDLSNRQRYLNAKSTLTTLLTGGVVPIINENDTVVTDEIRFGDNDTLAGLVANLVAADMLVILTDQSGVFDADPRQDSRAKLIGTMSVEDRKLDQVAGDSGSALGRGGMLSKIRAARIAARSGANTVIASGHETDVLLRWQRGETPGTLLCASQAPVVARKQWLAGQLQVQGRLTLDRGAVDVLQQKGSSLLAVGVTAVSGSFERGSVVVCWDEHGQEVGRGLSNYNAAEARRIMGYSSHEIEGILGYMDEPELIHRDNLVLTDC